MTAWAKQKQFHLILTAIVITVFIVSSILFAIKYNPPSCDDGLLNGSELGVDCGGECERECPVPLSDLVTVWTRVFPIDDRVYAAVAYIDNQNSGHYIPSIQYEFMFYDESGIAVNRSSSFTTISSGGITPVFVPHVLSEERVISNVTFRFVGDPLQYLIPTNDDHSFLTRSIDIEAGEGKQPRVVGLVENISTVVVPEVEFVLILYDQENTAVAASRTFERNMFPNEKRELLYTWVNPFVLNKVPCAGGLCSNSITRGEIIPIVTK